MPERRVAPVRTAAGTVVCEESAGVRQGTAGHVGHVGLRPTVAPILALSPQGEPRFKHEEGTKVGCLDFPA